MATSDSEEFESADEIVDANSASGKKGQKSASKGAEAKKTSKKSPSSSSDVKKSEPTPGDSRIAPKKLESNESVENATGSIDDEKVFDMFDDKTSQRPLASKENIGKKSAREPRPSNIGKKLGSKLGTSVSAKEKIEKSKVDIDSKKKVDETTVKQEEKTDKKVNEPEIKKSENVDKSSKDSHADDGWELEDGFEVPVSNNAKPKHQQEFEKELFPVLNKLSSLTTSTKAETAQPEDKPPASVDSGASSSWSGWGNWGVSSILSTATESVTTLTSHVSAGLNTVLETGLGAPDPQVLAEVIEKEKEEGKGNDDKPPTTESELADASESTIGFGGIGQLMSGVSQLGTKVLTGGLDTLETLGKKTMEVLQDGDPGLRKKRALFFQDDDKPVLSQILREAKESAEKSDKMEVEKQAAKRVHLESLFDDYQGLVHLEALEMLSNQCQLKLQSILLGMTGDELKDLQETLEQVKELCELPDEEEDDDKDDDVDFKDKLTEAVGQLCKDVPHSKIFEVSQRIDDWLKSDEAKAASPLAVHEKAVASMAEFTSVSMEIFHRAAELLLIKPAHSTATEAECLTQITTILCIHVSRMATKFTMLLTENSESKENNKIITTIFMESAQCSSYIQDACRLVVPVLQVGAAN